MNTANKAQPAMKSPTFSGGITHKPRRARFRSNRKPATNPARYASPYHRSAKPPEIGSAMGFKSCT